MQLQNLDNKLKAMQEKFQAQTEELKKEIAQLKSKENQYKHEIKSRDLQIDKFKQQLSQKLFEKATKP